MWSLFKYVLTLGGLLIAQAALALSPATSANISKDIIYGYGETSSGEKALLLDLYQPELSGNAPPAERPAVLLIHGGSFQTGSKENSALVQMATDLALRGYVAAVMNYRLQGDQPVPSDRVSHLPTQSGVRFPMAQQIAAQAALDDAITAFEWLLSKQNEYRISDIGLIGSSAGAITAINLAYISDDFNIDLPGRHRISFVVNYWGGALLPLDDAEQAVQSVDAGEAPIFIVHGSGDFIVPFSYSTLLDERAKSENLDYEYHIIEGGGHGFSAINPFTFSLSNGLTIADTMYNWISNISNHSISTKSMGSWYEPSTSGQGMLIDLDDRTRQLFAAWFTYNDQAGTEGGGIPGAEQRWFTAQGKYSGRKAVLDVYQSRGGRFDSNNTVSTQAVGTLELELSSCKKAKASYRMPSLGLSGEIDLARLLNNSSCN